MNIPTFKSYPDTGERSFPFYLSRLDDAIPQAVTGLSRSIMETFKQHVYVTPSGIMGLPQLELIHKVVGADRILYSVDYRI